jgi:hypothetical protein
MSKIYRGCIRLLFCGFLVTICGAGAGKSNETGPPIQVVDTSLTPERARQALIELLEPSYEGKILSDHLMTLRSDRGAQFTADHCDLEKQSFDISRHRLCLFVCRGVFERTDGKWRARFTDRAWVCGMDKD